MQTYIIVYDLIKERNSADYTKLINAIKSFETWCHPTESTWLVQTKRTAQGIYDVLNPLMDANDKLLITRASADAKWKNLALEVSEWLKKAL